MNAPASEALISGEINPLNDSYVINLNAMNCVSGDVISREQVEAPTKNDVLAAVSTAAVGLRAALGESLQSIETLNTPIEQATTGSFGGFEIPQPG